MTIMVTPMHTEESAVGAAPPQLDDQDLTILAETFRLLGDPTRLRIMMFCLPEPKSVGDIASSLDLTQTLVSHHLRLLRGARLMRGDRQSRQVFYQLADAHVRDILIDMSTHIAEHHHDD
ncbi:ArsR/SmtB family transcription factor [Paracoccus aerodenitrificans]|uniref:ArsR/SmtB family transcription factor n=1 Tax=Paracoccus aerodenitrificans TaxID=3017781 RepID=UPI003EBCA0FB